MITTVVTNHNARFAVVSQLLSVGPCDLLLERSRGTLTAGAASTHCVIDETDSPRLMSDRNR